jgi:hypothetical protein
LASRRRETSQETVLLLSLCGMCCRGDKINKVYWVTSHTHGFVFLNKTPVLSYVQAPLCCSFSLLPFRLLLPGRSSFRLLSLDDRCTKGFLIRRTVHCSIFSKVSQKNGCLAKKKYCTTWGISILPCSTRALEHECKFEPTPHLSRQLLSYSLPLTLHTCSLVYYSTWHATLWSISTTLTIAQLGLSLFVMH